MRTGIREWPESEGALSPARDNTLRRPCQVSCREPCSSSGGFSSRRDLLSSRLTTTTAITIGTMNRSASSHPYWWARIHCASRRFQTELRVVKPPCKPISFRKLSPSLEIPPRDRGHLTDIPCGSRTVRSQAHGTSGGSGLHSHMNMRIFAARSRAPHVRSSCRLWFVRLRRW